MKGRLQTYCLYLNLLIQLIMIGFIAFCSKATPESDVIVLLLCFLFFLTAALYIVSAVFSLERIKEDYLSKDISVLAKQARRNKMTALPYFIIYLLMYAAFLFFTFVASISFFSFKPALLMFLLPVCWCYLVVVSTSLYGIALLLRLHKDGLMSRGRLILHLALHLFFVCDVADALYMSGKAQKCGQNRPQADQ